jgi:hypothetical protein
MMLGGVGFQVGLDEARRKQRDARRQADIAAQVQELEALRDRGALTPEEFEQLKRKLRG